MTLQKIKSTEKIVRRIEIDNTLVFETSKKETKTSIKKEVENLFKVKVEAVNTLIRNNKKLAYVKLKKEFPAIDVATKLGMI